MVKNKKREVIIARSRKSCDVSLNCTKVYISVHTFQTLVMLIRMSVLSKVQDFCGGLNPCTI